LRQEGDRAVVAPAPSKNLEVIMPRKADMVIAVLMIGLGAYVFYEALSFPVSIVDGAPGAGRLPMFLGSLLFILSLILFIQSTGFFKQKTAEKRENEIVNWKALGKILIGIFCTILYLVLLEDIDIFILIPFLLLSIMLLMGERNITALIAVPICFNLFVFIVFYKIFGVALPTIYF
jgi:hypothetical protein